MTVFNLVFTTPAGDMFAFGVAYLRARTRGRVALRRHSGRELLNEIAMMLALTVSEALIAMWFVLIAAIVCHALGATTK